MVAWSTLCIGDGSSTSSSENSFNQTSKQTPFLEDALKCYVCEKYFSKPRILPCGHTYCAGCLLSMRENAVHEFNKTRDRNAHRRGECGFFTCPWPNCHYSMKIMNVWRWTLKNKAMTHAVAIVKKQEREQQTIGTQTDVRLSDVMLSLPKTLLSPLCIKNDQAQPQSPTETILNHVVQNAASADCLTIQYCRPPGEENGGKTWKNYALMFGLMAVDQFLKINPF